MITDEDLLLAYRTGDALSYQDLYYRHCTPLFSFIENQVRNASLAEDIAQEVWFRLILKIDHFCEMIEDPATHFSLKPYLYRMATNQVIDYYRKNARLEPVTDDDYILDPGAVAPEQLISREELLRCVALRLCQLRLKVQQAFWLTRDSRMTYAQAADVVGVATETVKDWVKQALRAIRPCREDFEHDEP